MTALSARFNGVRDMTAAIMSKFDADMAACRDRTADGCNGTGPAKQGSSTDSDTDTDTDTGSDGAITDMDVAEDDKSIGGDTVAEEAESVQPIDDGNDPPKLVEP
ncbi:unnamed protein product [Ectocarpus sp. CCAP 1310/34]|nr:unnamed protein product [Ectocarpus sp. CCAP 1310/34]